MKISNSKRFELWERARKFELDLVAARSIVQNEVEINAEELASFSARTEELSNRIIAWQDDVVREFMGYK